MTFVQKLKFFLKRGFAAVAVFACVFCTLTGCNNEYESYSGSSYPPLVLGSGLHTATTEFESSTVAPEVTSSPTDVPVVQPEMFTFTGRAYCIADAETGEIFMSENPEGQLYIASITKLLTALTSLDYFSIDDSITIADGWLDLLKVHTDIDAYGMKVGSTYRVKDILALLLLESQADAALTLQYAVEAKSGNDFIELMNKKAAELGMSDSHFDNPIGLDTGNGFTENYSNAADTVKLMYAAYNNETVMSICSMREAVLQSGKTIKNTAQIYGSKYDSDKYYVLGGKTGSTKASGYSFACVCEDSDTGKKYIIVYLNGTSNAKMCTELSAMMEYVC